MIINCVYLRENERSEQSEQRASSKRLPQHVCLHDRGDLPDCPPTTLRADKVGIQQQQKSTFTLSLCDHYAVMQDNRTFESAVTLIGPATTGRSTDTPRHTFLHKEPRPEFSKNKSEIYWNGVQQSRPGSQRVGVSTGHSNPNQCIHDTFAHKQSSRCIV